MNKLYILGTRLITERLSQAALYVELFRVEPYSLIKGEAGNYKPFVGEGDDWLADAWQVTVTEENQKWLSPVPMVGDYYTRQNAFWDYILYVHMGDGNREIGKWCGGSSEAKEQIINRLYPNGQRAPMIEWDEVITKDKPHAN